MTALANTPASLPYCVNTKFWKFSASWAGLLKHLEPVPTFPYNGISKDACFIVQKFNIRYFLNCWLSSKHGPSNLHTVLWNIQFGSYAWKSIHTGFLWHTWERNLGEVAPKVFTNIVVMKYLATFIHSLIKIYWIYSFNTKMIKYWSLLSSSQLTEGVGEERNRDRQTKGRTNNCYKTSRTNRVMWEQSLENVWEGFLEKMTFEQNLIDSLLTS